MQKVIAFSGSAIKNGNIEQGLQAVLEATGAQTELIRLIDLDLKVCVGCKKCAHTNRCIHQDGLNDLLEKIIISDALILSAYPSFGSINALTKIFIERLWPLRHNHMLTKGKVGAAVACGVEVPQELADYFKMYFTDYLQIRYQGTLALQGNVPCMSCGYGEECGFSGWLMLQGAGAKVITPADFTTFNKNLQAQQQARELGQAIKVAMAATA